MADNTQLPIPETAGDIVAADDISGVKFQRVKMTLGADGINDGDVSSANPMPVAGNLSDGSASTGQMLLVGGQTAGGIAQAFETNGSGHLNISDGGGSITVDATTLPLPTGAATETTLATLAGVVKAEDSAGADGDPGIVILAQRRDSDSAATDLDGDYATLKMDEAGRLKVAAQPASYALVTGAITANAQTVFLDCSRGSNVIAHMVATSLVGHNSTFEGSIDSTNGTDGNWFGIQAVRTNANTIETTTGTLAATPAYGWELSVNGLKYVRVRATAHTSGTATWKFQQAPYATEPIPAAQISGTQPVALAPSASQGASTHHHAISAASTNATSVKTSAGAINDIELSNNGASAAYFKLYNKASAPTVGTDTPIKTILIPAGQTVVFCSSYGVRLTTGIAYALTTGMAVADTTAVNATQVSVGISYT